MSTTDQPGSRDPICENYNHIADWFDEVRHKTGPLMEVEYLEAMAARLPHGSELLDLGCGTGEPLAAWFIGRGHHVTGVDGSPRMIELCRQRFPQMTWKVGLIQEVDVGRTFDGIIAWDSTFHLGAADQRTLFPKYGRWLRPGGLLLFTSGPAEGEAAGTMQDLPFTYASLSAEEYRRLLGENGFSVLLHRIEDPNCGNHTVWLAQKAVPG